MRIALFILLALFALPAAAQTNLPDTFLRETYDHYVGDHARGLKLSSASQLQQIFTPDLAKAIASARKAGKLNRDPLVDSKSFRISNMHFSIEDSETGSAQAEASFDNNGADTTIQLVLVSTHSGWRIADVVSEQGSLREQLVPKPIVKPVKKNLPKKKTK